MIGGILTIAIADAFSDALGIHVSEGVENAHTGKQIWASPTVATFLSKLVFALTFLLPVMLFELSTAILISEIWGLSIPAVFSYRIAKSQNVSVWKVVAEHLLIALAVIAITHLVGDWISSVFG